MASEMMKQHGDMTLISCERFDRKQSCLIIDSPRKKDLISIKISSRDFGLHVGYKFARVDLTVFLSFRLSNNPYVFFLDLSLYMYVFERLFYSLFPYLASSLSLSLIGFQFPSVHRVRIIGA